MELLKRCSKNTSFIPAHGEGVIYPPLLLVTQLAPSFLFFLAPTPTSSSLHFYFFLPPIFLASPLPPGGHLQRCATPAYAARRPPAALRHRRPYPLRVCAARWTPAVLRRHSPGAACGSTPRGPLQRCAAATPTPCSRQCCAAAGHLRSST
jgi:hypothetical protein